LNRGEAWFVYFSAIGTIAIPSTDERGKLDKGGVLEMASRIWKDGTRRGIVYVEGREAAERVMQAAGIDGGFVLGRKIARDELESQLRGAMAVYTDRKGRPFAWQIPFDIARLEQVSAAAHISE
jgi:hypothetical protein